MIKLTEEQQGLLHFSSNSRDIRFRYDLLNFEEFKIGELDVASGKIGLNSLAEIKRTGAFEIKENELKDVDWINSKIRPMFMLKNNDKWHEWSLGVYLISSPSVGIVKGKYRKVEAYDANEILMEDKFINRYFIKKGTNYVKAVTQIINSAGIYKVNIIPHPGKLNSDKEFEIGESKLTVVNELLRQINYTSIFTDEWGYMVSKPYVLPNLREVEYSYKENETSIILIDSTKHLLDTFNVPNIFVGTVSTPEGQNLRSVYTNNNPLSPISTVRRKRNIVMHEEVTDILDQVTLDNYIKRLAYNNTKLYERLIFDTAIMPHHSYSDCLFVNGDKYIETDWAMGLETGGVMTHNCRKVTNI
ncbi:hypothetical protein EV204_11245 [Tissierella praeacuta]|uniref:hypothetical protein n=1 Tax=Tissierella praeacuta TaxID=43131 RepID=UPI00104EF033|nr:hypothetical protein [Tissierella praeacuta]TCU67494.1 hypothetical protein EV204_11245 [Tissierella praeacuta]